MRRLMITGLFGLALAPLAWSSGAISVHDEAVFADSVAATWQGLFAGESAEQRDLSGLLLVSNEHREGTGHRVDLVELDARLSDAEFEHSEVERAVNRAQWPTQANPRGRDYLRTKVLQELGRIAIPPSREARPTVFVPTVPASQARVDEQTLFHKGSPFTRSLSLTSGGGL